MKYSFPMSFEDLLSSLSPASVLENPNWDMVSKTCFIQGSKDRFIYCFVDFPLFPLSRWSIEKRQIRAPVLVVYRHKVTQIEAGNFILGFVFEVL